MKNLTVSIDAAYLREGTYGNRKQRASLRRTVDAGLCASCKKRPRSKRRRMGGFVPGTQYRICDNCLARMNL